MHNKSRMLAALLAISPACSSNETQGEPAGERHETGELALSLLVGGLVIDSVHFEITGNGYERMGDLPVSGTGASFSAFIPDIPVGTGYQLRLTAVPADAGVGCAGEALFDIVAFTTTPVSVTLACDDLTTNLGAVSINGGFNICPSVRTVTASPSSQVVGGQVDLTASARDLDNGPAALRSSWVATPDGTFSSVDALATSYTCTSAGTKSLTLSVTDSLCSKSNTPPVVVSCVTPDAGLPDSGMDSADGGVEDGGGADSGAQDSGSSDSGVDSADGGIFDGGAGDGGLADGGLADGGSDAGIALVRINEIESRGGVPADWIELFNASSTPVTLDGWALRDENRNHVYAFPASTTIAPNAYLVVEEAALGYGYGDSDGARLYAPGDVQVDAYSWTVPAAVTYGRCPNGAGPIVDTALSTKGAPNVCGPAPAPRPLINEVESQARGGQPDWVELFNPGTDTLDLTAWTLRGNGSSAIYPFPSGTSLAPGQYLMIDQTVFGFGLGASESVRLFWVDGTTQIDISTWMGHAAITWGRCPNGTGTFRNTSASTPGATNGCP